MTDQMAHRETQIVEVERAGRVTELAPRPAAANKGLKDLQKVHRLMRGRYKWAFLLSSCLGAGLAYAGFRAGGKTYQSTGVIRVMPVVPTIMYQVDDKGALPGFDTYVDAQVALLKSQRLVDQAMEDPAWKGAGQGRSDQAMIAFMKSLEVTKQGDMIWVRSVQADSGAAMATVNATIAAYRKVYAELEAQSGDKRRELREEYRTKLANEWGALRAQILAIAKTYGSDDLRAQYQFKLAELNKLESAIGEMKMTLPTLSAGGAGGPATRPVARETREPSVTELAAVDERMRDLVRQQFDAEQRATNLRAHNLGERNPMVVAARSDLQAVGKLVEARAKELRGEWKERNEGGAAALASPSQPRALSAEALQERIDAYERMYKARNEELLRLGQEQLQIEELHAKADQVKAELDETTRTIEKLDLESQVTGRIHVMSEADHPLAPFRDTRPTYAAAGGMGGAALGLGLVALLGLLNRRLDRPDDADEDLAGAALLGVLPVLPEDLADAEQAALASHCVHGIRTRLQIMGHDVGESVFAITSPVAGTGKTSLTLALGVSFAGANLRTLIIDLDLVGRGLTTRVDGIVRRKIGQILQREGLITEAQLHEALKLAQGSRRLGEILVELGYLSDQDLASAVSAQTRNEEIVGVLDALSGEDVLNCVTDTGIPGLSVLPLGAATAQHVPRLSPASVARLIKAARGHYDVILIDTGPVPGSLEASVVASQADAVVLTVSRGEQRSLALQAVTHLASLGANVAGIVFNRARKQDLDRFESSGGLVSAELANGLPGSSRFAETAEFVAEDRGTDDEFAPRSRLGPIGGAVAARGPSVGQEDRSVGRGRR